MCQKISNLFLTLQGAWEEETEIDKKVCTRVGQGQSTKNMTGHEIKYEWNNKCKLAQLLQISVVLTL